MHLAVLGTVGDAPFANTFWVRNGNAITPSQGDLTAWVSNFGLYYRNRILPHLSSSVVLSEVTALYYDTNGAELAAAVSETGNGGVTGPVTPANVSLCIGWRVQQHYRGGHPRTYLPGIPQAEVATARLFNAAYVGLVVQSASDFHGDVNNTPGGNIQGAKLGIVSFVLRKEWRNPPVFRDFVYPSAHGDPRIDSMRRRLGHDIPP
jgi:hypothetical protein